MEVTNEYRISMFVIGDSFKDGKNQVITANFGYYTKDIVEKPNLKRLNELKTFLNGIGADYTNLRLIVKYNTEKQRTYKTSRKELMDLDCEDFILSKQESELREKIRLEILRKHLVEKAKFNIK